MPTIRRQGHTLVDGSGADAAAVTGKERDAETGLQYFGSRNYSETTTRWMSVDPVLHHISDPPSLNKIHICQD